MQDTALIALCLLLSLKAGSGSWQLLRRRAAEHLTEAGEMDLAIRCIQAEDDAAICRLIADLKRQDAQIAAPEPRTAHDGLGG